MKCWKVLSSTKNFFVLSFEKKSYWFFVGKGLKKLEKWCGKYVELLGEYVEYAIPLFEAKSY